MNKFSLIMCLILCLGIGECVAQNNIISPGFWGAKDLKDKSSKIQPISWTTMEFGKKLLDLRWNFDYANTLSLYGGYRFKLNNAWKYKAEAGYTLGKGGTSIGQVNYLTRNTEKMSYLFNLQGNLGLDKPTPNYVYEWVDVAKKFSFKNGEVKVGLSQQYWNYFSTTNWRAEVGPTLMLRYGPVTMWDFFWLARYDQKGVVPSARINIGLYYDIGL